MTGTIKSVNTEKGYGFIVDSHGVEYFFHKSGLKNRGFDQLRHGQAVRFDDAPSAKGPRAENVTVEGD